jgi:hypothetical protein
MAIMGFGGDEDKALVACSLLLNNTSMLTLTAILTSYSSYWREKTTHF